MSGLEKDQTAAEHVWTGEGFPALLRGKVAVVTGANAEAKGARGSRRYATAGFLGLALLPDLEG